MKAGSSYRVDIGVPELPFAPLPTGLFPFLLVGTARELAIELIRKNHYTRSVPSGKSHYIRYGDALVVWSIPANKNIARFLLGTAATVWELSRLWAPDRHAPNLLTQAISAAIGVLRELEHPDAAVSYADPAAGHHGGIYRAASWIYSGQSEENRTYRSPDGGLIARRAFHSGKRFLTKREIESRGFSEVKAPGKERFVHPFTRAARRALAARFPPGGTV